MKKAYIIIRGWGEYSDRGTTPAKVYLDRTKAEAVMAKLEAIDLEFTNKRKLIENKPGYFEKVKELKPEAVAAYAAIGFDADQHDDWELAEAELVTNGQSGSAT